MGPDAENTAPRPTDAVATRPRGHVMPAFWADWLRTRLLRKTLPRLLVIGDSISVHYAPYLEAFLQDRFECVTKDGGAAALANLDVPLGTNWGDSARVLDRLRTTRLLDVCRADLALVNCGLHDVKRKAADGDCQVPLALYRENLEAVVEIFARSRTRMVWVATTPVEDERHRARMKDFARFDRDCVAYNAAAAQIMQAHDVHTIDLYGFTKSLGADVYGDHVHFVESVREKQAAFLAEWLAGWLQRGKS